jgi:CubicO group peptidase (beta-lactamase class C family)
VTTPSITSTNAEDPQSAPDAPRRRPTRAILAVIGAAAVVGVAFGAAIGPQHQTVSASTAGDEALADRIRSLPGSLDSFRALSVAEISHDGAVFAGLGDADPSAPGAPTADTVFELGSITKTFTGALFADAIDRGEVDADDQLAEHLPDLEGTAAGEVTLASLSQHSSGLPGLGATAEAASLSGILLNENPYATTSTEQLIADAAVAAVDPDQGSVYSNFAVSLLGTALVEAADADDYAALLRERITEPLGMDDTVLAATADEVPADAVPGFLTNGTPASRWWGEGYLPAGSSTFTTAADLATWAQANLDGTAPGQPLSTRPHPWEKGPRSDGVGSRRPRSTATACRPGTTAEPAASARCSRSTGKPAPASSCCRTRRLRPTTSPCRMHPARRFPRSTARPSASRGASSGWLCC